MPPKTLRVSAIPDEAPTELIRKFKPLGEYLEQQLGMPVKFTPVSDYAAVVESLASDRLDLAWLGGFTFVQTRLKTGDAIPLVQREQDEQFTSKFITADPEVKSLADLKGKTFAFGSVSSTSGSLMPRYFMLKDGIEPEQYFKRIAYSGAHDATAAWVEAGKRRRRRAQRLGLGQAGRGRQGRYRQGASDLHHPALLRLQLTVRGNLDPALVEKIKAAFLALDPANPEHKAILDLQAASRFIETKPENYAGIEEAARSRPARATPSLRRP